ncbi:hypothetical protein [Sphingomonas mollis]|uniref:Lipoprotein n=1 Tax=Sphingomonas mollis TaxID=2795726 RepID=A0ABS0XU97_9SPHN|nr:hypothetical protein [Sphingomonas sp. BT553]MBJ6123616.1 hypothetical protein [Sphingomonas sp. BT553]
MRWALPILVTISGCSTPKLAKLEVPDGRHRRPANLYGTVLPSVDAVAGTVVAPARRAPTVPPDLAAPTMVFPAPGPATPATRPDAQVPALDTAPDSNTDTRAPTDPMEK